MARRGTHRLWLVVLLVAAGIGLAGGTVAGRPESRTHQQPVAAAFTPTEVEAAVVPGRTQSAAGIGARHAPVRSLLPLLGALVALAGLGALVTGRSVPAFAGTRPLVDRRHSIALRAPPSVLLV